MLLTSFVVALVAVLMVLVSNSSAEKIYDYNRVDAKDYHSFEEFSHDFLRPVTDNNGQTIQVVTKNLFIGIATDECYEEQLSSPELRGAQRHAGGHVLATALLHANEFPLTISNANRGNCAEVLFYRVNTDIMHPTARTTSLEHRDLTGWAADQIRTSFRFTNRFPFPVEFVWHEESHESVDQGIIEPGESIFVNSFLGHIFAANREEENSQGNKIRELVDFMVVDGEDYEFSASNRLESCEISEYSSGTLTGERFVDDGELSCEDMEKRFLEFSNQVWYSKRLGLNYVQPKLVPPVTETGFELHELPKETYKWLLEWYREQQALEEITEGGVGPCMNQHRSPSGITHISPEKKEQLRRDLQPYLEEWFGGELRLTSIYGIRKYTNGSVLRMHVDTVSTHVVSAIINVDQEVSKQWPLLILDHEDNEHWINMKPGDMIYYESAKLLHGRPVPLDGLHYDNIFIHFQPVSGWDYSWV